MDYAGKRQRIKQKKGLPVKTQWTITRKGLAGKGIL
jgi:hypothetical protein